MCHKIQHRPHDCEDGQQKGSLHITPSVSSWWLVDFGDCKLLAFDFINNSVGSGLVIPSLSQDHIIAGGGAYRHWREPMTHGFEHTGSRLWFSIPKNVALTLGQTANRLIGSCDQYRDILGPLRRLKAF